MNDLVEHGKTMFYRTTESRDVSGARDDVLLCLINYFISVLVPSCAVYLL